MNFKTFVLPDPHQLKTGSEDDVFSKSGKTNGHSIKEKTPFSVLISTKNIQFVYKFSYLMGTNSGQKSLTLSHFS